MPTNKAILTWREREVAATGTSSSTDAMLAEILELRTRVADLNAENTLLRHEVENKADFARGVSNSAEKLRNEVERLSGSELGLNRYLASVQNDNKQLRNQIVNLEAGAQLAAASLARFIAGYGQTPDDQFGIGEAKTAIDALTPARERG